jgi:hypothetical protein
MLSSIPLVLAPAALSWSLAQIPENIDLRPPRQIARFAPTTLVTGASFGYSVALDADTLVVGAPFHDTVGGKTGAAWVFERDGRGAWQEVAELDPAGTGFAAAEFGHAVAVAGDVLAVGAPFADSPASPNAGAVLVYERLAGVWTPVATLTGGVASNLGTGVAVDGSTLVAGGYGCNAPAGCLPFEQVEVHERDAGGPSAWGQTAVFTTSSPYCSGFGRSVDIEGDRIAADPLALFREGYCHAVIDSARARSGHLAVDRRADTRGHRSARCCSGRTTRSGHAGRGGRLRILRGARR